MRAAWLDATAATEVRLDPTSASTGTAFDAESELGLDEEPGLARFELMLRAGSRSRLRADFFDLDRAGDAVLERRIVFGDEVFDVSERVVSRLDMRALTFAWTYSFVRHEHVELAAGLGIHLLDIEAGAEVAAQARSDEVSQSGALPSIALDFAWAISPRTALAGHARYFTAAVDELDGSLGDFHVGVEYRLRPKLAFGAGYSWIALDVDVTDAAEPGRLDLDVRGPELFLRASY